MNLTLVSASRKSAYNQSSTYFGVIMIYSQFKQAQLQNRLSGARGWVSFAIGILFLALILVALPFILLIGAVSFITLGLFGRVFLKRQLARFRQQQEQDINTSPSEASSLGRTFEHNPNEK
ncbi:hypothetical protein [Shewanella surugensis]|uniref:Uncharacterized protein n=1 Tax=Shewanella surugensis TaxID=212020 RepID=A0ABT0LC77_9GAMM|nr:hypothetical protein [Shewanella surugensis]MCL1125154.1 hypothetical protein [Shewanella surugensis]